MKLVPLLAICAIIVGVELWMVSAEKPDKVKAKRSTASIDEFRRVDCHPEPDATKDVCLRRGCIWEQGSDVAPWCYFPENTGYKKSCPSSWTITGNGDSLETAFIMEKVGAPCPFGPDVSQIQAASAYKAQMGDNGTLNIRITDPSRRRYEPPIWLPNQKYPYECGECDQLVFQHGSVPNAGIDALKVIRKSTKRVLWDTSVGGLMFSDQFLQIASLLPSKNVYGFGEHTHQTLKHQFSKSTTWPMFTRDEPPTSAHEDTKNLYGVHPFYLCVEPDGKAHGVLIFNSNAQEVTLAPGPGDTGLLTYRTIGGILDLYFFPGPQPKQVIQQYLALIGYPVMPAYWGLGFQLSRWGYKTLSRIEEVVKRNRELGVPQETQVFDIDYMNRYKDFTSDKKTFANIAQWVEEELHSKGMKLITILDPAIDVYSFEYGPFKTGLDKKVYINWENKTYVTSCTNQTSPYFLCPLNNVYETTKDTTIMLGTVWPDHNTAFPDWLKSETSEWWVQEIKNMHLNVVPFDGLWIDMNEPANFATNNPDAWYFGNPDHPNVGMLFCPENHLDDPPYKTWSVYKFQYAKNPHPRLSNKTLCMTALQGQHDEFHHYDVHNIYGFSESEPTMKGIQQATSKRGVVISRSTFVSSGRYAGHWLGDNTATWDDLRTSIIGILEFNFFGIPYIGADVCGFFSNTTEELCLRWQQAGAFYPFYRNHNGNNNRPQDPAEWPSVAAATKKATEFRYRYLPHLYTLFYKAWSTGEPVLQPLFFLHPTDPIALNVDKQFLWGDAFLITPVMEARVDKVKGYIPKELWYSIYDFDYGQPVKKAGSWMDFPAPNNSMIPVHVRGGRVFPRQAHAMTTSQARKSPLDVLVAPDVSGKANGSLFWDDGEAIQVNGFFYQFSFEQTNSEAKLEVSVKAPSPPPTVPDLKWELLEVFNYPKEPDWSSFKFNSKQVTIGSGSSSYEPTSKILHVKFALPDAGSVLSAGILSWKNSP